MSRLRGGGACGSALGERRTFAVTGFPGGLQRAVPGRRSLQLNPGKEVVTSRRAGTLGVLPGNRGELRAHRPFTPTGEERSDGLSPSPEEGHCNPVQKERVEHRKVHEAQLIVQLEEDDRSKEQIPDPNGAIAGSGSSWRESQASLRLLSPTRRGSSRLGSPSGDRRRTGLELSPREQEDCERQREPEKELQKQQQHELAVVERRGLGDLPGKKIILVDITVPFENRSPAFREARAQKLEKYAPLANTLRAKGYEVQLDALIVGALGAWDPCNERVLWTCGIGKRYARLM
ncbi:hypothetical protein UY3_01365 [Chelonia mydas]|uniref:Uncharacterized protein n=1 Tax=Chelonia mydas TaxID=8469 RepID=M7BW16_CHEMY|nr:hypothetical protein UY3_01365 [Chelonia mydas]